jgi:hypothetical protein
MTDMDYGLKRPMWAQVVNLDFPSNADTLLLE